MNNNNQSRRANDPYSYQNGQRNNRPYSGAPKKRRKKKSFASVMITIILFAVIFTALIFAAIWFSGVRYIKVQVTDELYVKFLGQVDDEGNPYKGRIIYSDGITADVNLDREEISYSNGDIYRGELENLLKNGTGTIQYANGDVYEGRTLIIIKKLQKTPKIYPRHFSKISKKPL